MANNCWKCKETIETNACMKCIEKGIEFWLMINRRWSLIPLLRAKTEIFPNYSSENRCLLCENNINTCINCYVNYIAEWLNQDYPWLASNLSEFKGKIESVVKEISVKMVKKGI